MRDYHNLLYVSHGTTDESAGLKQALSLARNNQAMLKIMIISPEFPKDFPDYQQKYEETLRAQTRSSVEASLTSLGLAADIIPMTIELLSDKTPAVKIIQEILRHGHDLVIKEAEPRDKITGFKAIDMDLLRKSPVPVWLSRPIPQSRQDIQVAVAIDPESEEAAAEALSRHMLQLSRSLADSCSGKLQIISCWDYAFEGYLRDSSWMKSSDSEIAKIVEKAEKEHYQKLLTLIKDSSIEGNYQIHHLRGGVSECLPVFVQQQQIDILVMGTLARTGIPGFIIGNSAENIVQNLSCSLLALKPQGFTSPVKAYT